MKAPSDLPFNLGLLVLSPRSALEAVSREPVIPQALLVLGMSVLSVVLAWHASAGQRYDSAWANLRLIGSSAGPFLSSWLLCVLAWHLASGLFGKEGRFASFFCAAAWSAAAFWLALPLTMVSQSLPQASWAVWGLLLLVRVVFLAGVWRGLQLVYGWSPGDALAMTVLPYILVKIFCHLLFSFRGIPLISGG